MSFFRLLNNADMIVGRLNSFWGRDPRIWEDPDQFIPERWLESHNPRASQLPNVYDIAFGLGRR